MQKFCSAMSVINWLVVIVIGAFLLVCFFAWNHGFIESDLADFVEHSENKWWVIGVAIILLGLNATALIFRILTAQYDDHIRFTTPRGEVMIAVSALEESLTRTALAQSEVSDIRINILVDRAGKKNIKVLSSGSIWDAPNVRGITEKIQNALEKRLSDILQLEEPVDFVINLKKFRFAKEVSRKTTEEELRGLEEELETPFRGPQYPIEE